VLEDRLEAQEQDRGCGRLGFETVVVEDGQVAARRRQSGLACGKAGREVWDPHARRCEGDSVDGPLCLLASAGAPGEPGARDILAGRHG
jgi:hypothetical protein